MTVTVTEHPDGRHYATVPADGSPRCCEAGHMSAEAAGLHCAGS